MQEPSCRGLYDSARQLSQAGQYDAALVAYQSAYARQPVPWLLLNIGRMQQKAGRPQQAIIAYRKFLESPAAANKPQLAQKAQEYLEQAEKEQTEKASAVSAPSKDEPRRAEELGAPSPAPVDNKPVYKKWWFWTIIGGAVAVTATGLAVGLALRQPTSMVPPGVQTYDPTF